MVAHVAFWAGMALRAEVPPVLVEVGRFLSTCSVSADTSLYHFGMEGRRPYEIVNHCRVSFHRSLHLLMPRKLNCSYLLFSDFSAVVGISVSHYHCQSAWQRTELRRVYGDTGMMKTDWARVAYGDQGWRSWTD
jgi:hypothetical protein